MFIKFNGFVEVFDGIDVLPKIVLSPAAIAPGGWVVVFKFDGFIRVFDGLDVLTKPLSSHRRD